MITKAQYFGNKPHTIAQEAAADKLLAAVNLLLHKAEDGCGYEYWIDPDTGTQISGAKGGAGDGGFRLPNSTTGAKSSKHKLARAVDVYDPNRVLAQWIVSNPSLLKAHGLYCEDFRWTPVWCHFQDIAPKSGMRIYIPAMTPALAPDLIGQKPLGAPFR